MIGPGMEARATSENIGGRDPIRKDLDVPEVRDASQRCREAPEERRDVSDEVSLPHAVAMEKVVLGHSAPWRYPDFRSLMRSGSRNQR
jgi:hypothetical protein